MWAPEHFWDFACRHYANESVKNTCLELQDRYGMNVNLLLFCAYLDHHGQALSRAAIQQVLECIQSSDEALIAFRQARKQAKHTDAYPSMLVQELELEKRQQQVLLETAGKRVKNTSQPHNLREYLYALSVAPDAEWRAKVEGLADMLPSHHH